MYSADKILWLKNVTRYDGGSWAYEDTICGKDFYLNWSSQKSAETPKIGDIILLFQRPKYINGKRNYKVRLTHLVSPVSHKAEIDPNNNRHPYIRKVEIVALANPISSIPNPGYYNFLKPNRGSTNPIINLANNIGMTEIEVVEDIWRLFGTHICKTILGKIFVPEESVGFYGEVEGDKIIRNHIKIELTNRNSKIVQLAKENAYKVGNGTILCECCGFDFFKVYQKLGFRFIECHHRIPLRQGERITEIKDLAMVCSNCHRMLHRRIENLEYHTVETLRDLINV